MNPSHSYCTLVLLVLLLERANFCYAQSTAQTSHSSPPYTEQQKKQAVDAAESSLLKMMGLKQRPRPSKNIVIPEYMIELYRQVSGDFDTDISSVFHRRGATVPSNTIRSFFHEDVLHHNGCSDHDCARLWFNVTYIPNSETLADAELRLFIERNKTHEPDNIHKVLKHKLQVFEIMKPVTHDTEPISRLIDVQDIIVQNSSWVSLDVRPAVLKWKSKPRTNHGLEIRLVPHKNNPTSTPLKHVRLRRAAETSNDLWNIQRPILVTYTDDGKASLSRTRRSVEDTVNSSDKSDTSDTSKSDKSKKKGRRCPRGSEGRACRKKRKERKERRKRKKEKKRKKNKRGNRKDKNKNEKNNPEGIERPGHKNLCQRKPLYVDFSDVGWNDWIVAPLGYQAYYCNGNCPFPLSDNLNATNHAIVQTLVNSVDAKAVPTACCVPTTLSAISMLYLDEYDKTILKQYDDMVVEGCGCR